MIFRKYDTIDPVKNFKVRLDFFEEVRQICKNLLVKKVLKIEDIVAELEIQQWYWNRKNGEATIYRVLAKEKLIKITPKKRKEIIRQLFE